MLALALLAVAGFVAGYVNAIAGAGSLLTLPALVFSGLDASAANSTNRIAVLFQNIASAAGYRSDGLPDRRIVAKLALPAAMGAAVGAWLATLLDASAIRVAIAVVMLVMLPLTFVRPSSDASERPFEVTPAMMLGFALLGVYGGFIQAGVGVLILFFLSIGFRTNLVLGNGVKTVMILIFTVVAIGTFVARGAVLDLRRGAVLAAAMSLGGYVGARAAIKRGEGFVRVGVVVAVVASAAKLLYDTFAG